MKISQGTIPHDYECRPFEVDGRPAGLLFYKDKTSVTAAVLTTVGLCISFYIWHISNIKAFAVSVIVVFTTFIFEVIWSREKNEKTGHKYFLKDIVEVKVLGDDTVISDYKSGLSSLSTAAVGGVLAGGVGAVVGSVAGGNKILEKNIVQVGIKFSDSNWVILRANIDETMYGQVQKDNLKAILEMTSSKQQAPF